MGALSLQAQRDVRGPRPLTVTELARLLRDTLRSNPLLDRVLVRGEIGDVSRTPAGHWFFTLRDEASQISCALFKEPAEALGFDLEPGMEVVASGGVDLYARRGEVQLIIRAATPAGVGAFWISFQRTRKRLDAEGLFDAARKRPLPRYPKRIGVVTSEAGAVLHDVVTILRRRFPLAEVILSPALVQGPEAPASLLEALLRVQGRADVIVIARGGGAIEDLAAFNDEAFARAIAACPTPVVSAVGHETDVTIADFVADVRAATPSAAAELVSPDAPDLKAHVRGLGERLLDSVCAVLRDRQTGLAVAARRMSPQVLLREVVSVRDRLQGEGAKLLDAIRHFAKEHWDALAAVAGRFDAVSPFATLRRGYAIAEREDGALVTRLRDVAVGDALRVRLSDGRLHARVDAKEETP
jgi:exodeoxyribonuclease VII large subunit